MIKNVDNLLALMGLQLSPSSCVQAAPNPGIGTVWSFVYVFFSNGTPFDSPNRSEVCPCAMTGR